MIRRIAGGLLVVLFAVALCGGTAAEVGWRQAIATWVLAGLLAAGLAGGLWLLLGGGR